MPKPKHWVTEPVTEEVSLVDDTDNPPAKFVLAKRHVGLGKIYQSAVDAVARVIGRKPGPDLRKRMYEEVRQDLERRRLLLYVDEREGTDPSENSEENRN